MDQACYFLRDKIYTNKILAVVREYISNALDEHIKYNVQTPVSVNLTTTDFSVRDYAKGLDETEISKMKQGAVLINCARGGVVNEIALARAMNEGKISFAGVDVFENEPPTNDTILSLNNASLSPHIGASTAEAQMRVGIELAEKIVQHLK
jgi:D-3-phosphoglycerate dehydrogenase